MQFSRVAKDLAICLNSPIISSISSCDIIGFVSLRSMKISIQTIQRAPSVSPVVAWVPTHEFSIRGYRKGFQ